MSVGKFQYVPPYISLWEYTIGWYGLSPFYILVIL